MVTASANSSAMPSAGAMAPQGFGLKIMLSAMPMRIRLIHRPVSASGITKTDL
jgi:hypothetical protein